MAYRPNATAASLLGFLHRRALTGWDAFQLAGATIGPFWSLTRSQVYRELSRMEEHGLVVAGEEGPRDRRPYSITDAGRRAFREWAAEVPSDATIRMPMLLAVALGDAIDDDVLAGHLADRRADHEARLADYEQAWQAGGTEADDRYARATLAFGLAHQRAVVDWFDTLPDILGPAFDTDARA